MYSFLDLLLSAGTVVLILNYTGDRINFGLAAEREKKNGEDVRGGRGQTRLRVMILRILI